MSRSILFGAILTSISIVFAGCVGPERDGGPAIAEVEGKAAGPATGIEEAVEGEAAGPMTGPKSEAEDKDTEIPSAETAEKEGQEAPVTAVEDNWIIPRDEGISSRFFADMADVCLRHRQRELALELFTEAIAREQSNEKKSSYYAKLAEVHSQARDSESAAEAYENALKNTESEATKKRYYGELARLYTRLRQYEKGIEAYKYLHEHEENESKKITTKRQMYTMYHKAGKLDEITKDLDARLEQEPESTETLEELVLIYSQVARQPGKAIPHLKKLSSMFPPPDNRKYLNQLVAMYRQLNMYNEHANVMLEIMDQVPENQHQAYMLSIARIYTESGDTVKALDMTERAVASDPESASALAQAATIYRRNNRKSKADEIFEKGMALSVDDPQKKMMLFQYGMANVTMKDYAEADKLFTRQEKLIEETPMKVQLYQAVSREFSRTGEEEMAEKWARKGIAADPNDPMSYSGVATLLHGQGNTEQARKILLEGIEALEDDQSKTHLMMGYYTYSMTLKDYEAARKVLDEISELSDNEHILKWVEDKRKILKKELK
jgi:tetratricopeptide (TPR) repeat protein